MLIVTARVTNQTKQTVYQLAGLSESDQILYTEREFLFGKLDPGQTIERSFETVLRPSSATRSDIIKVHLNCPGFEKPIESAQHEIVIDEALCQGCGVCTAVCPRQTIGLRNYEDDQLMCKIDCLLEN